MASRLEDELREELLSKPSRSGRRQPPTQAERDTLNMLLWPDDREHIEAIRSSSHGQMTISEAVRKALKLTGYLLSLPADSRILVVDQTTNKAKEIVII